MMRTPEEFLLFADHFMKYVPHVEALGLKLHELGTNSVSLILPYSEKLVGYPESGVIAGGAIFSLMDNVSGMAVFLALKAWQQTATLDLRIDYLKPATPGLSVIGRAECYKVTRRVAFVHGIAYHDDPARPIAQTTGSFMLARD
jgi:uncharacterized protein (TIGR00369 family)